MSKTNNTLNYDGEILSIGRRQYADGQTAITLTCENGEPYATVSVNLSAYGLTLPANQIAVDHNLMHDEELLVKFIKGFCEIPKDGKFNAVTYGPFNCESLILTLKDVESIPLR